MNDGSIKCMHGNPAHLVERPDLGPGYVEEVHDNCRLCLADPEFSKRVPYRPGNWQELEAQKKAKAAEAAAIEAEEKAEEAREAAEIAKKEAEAAKAGGPAP